MLVALAAMAACVDLNVRDGFPCSRNNHCPEPYTCFMVNGTSGCYRQKPTDGGVAGAAGAAGGRAGAAGGRAGNGGRAGSGPAGSGGSVDASTPPDGSCGSSSDRKNCGACGHDCTALPNVNPTAAGIECRAGVCYIPASACLANFGHCSSRADDGCEASLLDAQTCGTCTQKCTTAAPKCAASSSGPQCVASCPTATPNACGNSCVDLASDPLNCGSCGHDCAGLPNVAAGATGITCKSGVCNVPPSACAAGYGHCSTRADDGCETNLETTDDCGSCGKTCSAPTALCSGSGSTYACSSSCVSPAPNLCGSKCVSFSADPTNCGACNHDCTALPNVKAGATGIECRSGVCYVPPSACVSGFAHCSSQADDGCEASLSTSAHCGSCSLTCSGSTPICSLQTQPASCLPSCSGSTPNLCTTQCVNLMTDVKNCGACGHSCAALPNVKPTAVSPAVQCVAGACVLQQAACVSGYGHCSSKPDDGCETDLTRPQTCGSCSTTCTAPLGLCSTTSGTPTCSSSCTSPTPNLCGSKCVDTKTDPTNCGSCGHDCTALPHLKAGAAVTCNGSGGCVVPQSACATGYANCSSGSADTDGCESAINTNANCGGCGITCSQPNATASCASGTCTLVSCTDGFGDCTSAPGCESALDTPSHCGSCNACPAVPNGTPTCDSMSCGYSCPSGTLRCNTGANYCEPAGWTFESSTDGWTSPFADDRADDGTVALSTGQAHGGSRSLSAQVSFSASRYAFRLNHWPCGYPPFLGQVNSQTLDLRGRTFAFWIYLQPSAAGVPTTGHLCYPYAESGTTCLADCGQNGVPVTAGQWSRVALALGSDAGAVTQLGFDCRPVTSPAWTGTVYIDDASIQ